MSTSIMQALLSNVTPINVIDPEDREREERRKERIESCGAWVHRPDPRTGEYISFQTKCGSWRECPMCYEDRVREFEDRFARCLNTGEVKVGLTHRKVLRQLRYRGIEYWAIPVEGSTILLIHEACDEDLDLDLDPVNLDWTIYANTPPRRRYSGDLGRIIIQEEEKAEVEFTIPVRTFTFQGEGATPSEVKRIAAQRTNDLDPAFDEEDLRWATWQKSETLRRVAIELGLKVVDEQVTLVKVSDKNYRRWGSYRDYEPKEEAEELVISIPQPAFEQLELLET